MGKRKKKDDEEVDFNALASSDGELAPRWGSGKLQFEGMVDLDEETQFEILRQYLIGQKTFAEACGMVGITDSEKIAFLEARLPLQWKELKERLRRAREIVIDAGKNPDALLPLIADSLRFAEINRLEVERLFATVGISLKDIRHAATTVIMLWDRLAPALATGKVADEEAWKTILGLEADAHKELAERMKALRLKRQARNLIEGEIIDEGE